MNIEPCPFCGKEVRFDLGDLSAKCVSCFYTGPTDDNEAAAHNRLSRIVRAAEAWAGLFMSGVSEEYIPACRALMGAVEGGRSDED